MNVKNKRTEVLALRISTKDMNRVKRLAKAEDTTTSEYVRRCIRAAYEKFKKK